MDRADEHKAAAKQVKAKKRVLYIEDSPASRLLVRRLLKAHGFDVLEADNGMAGYEMAVKHMPDLIIVDLNLPGLTGYEVATKLKATAKTRNIPIIALTAYAMEGDREKALVAGCDGYMEKPIDVDSFVVRVAEYLGGKREEPARDVEIKYLREYSLSLVGRLEANIRELQRKNEQLESYQKKMQEVYIGIISSLMKAMEEKHFYTAGHSERVTQYSLEIADEMRISSQEKNILRRAALLHDIGKIAVETSTIDKNGDLGDREWDEMRRHPIIAASILKPLGFLDREIEAIRDHHERLDGSGYPAGKRGNEIGLLAKILAVADSFDAMTSFRRYRARLSEEEALKELAREAGTKYDVKVVEALIKARRKRGAKV